jgi:hypothetical protein
VRQQNVHAPEENNEKTFVSFLSGRRLKRELETRSPTEAGLVLLFRRLRSCAGVNIIARRIGYFEEDDDLPASLALERATVFLHGLDAYRAQRCHWVRGTPEAASGSTAL